MADFNYVSPPDYFMHPTPYYMRIYTDMGERSFVRPWNIHLSIKVSFTHGIYVNFKFDKTKLLFI